MKIKMIAFDLFGVVITEGHMVSNTLMPLMPKGSQKAVVKAYYNQYTRGEMTESQFWQAIGEAENTTLQQDFLNAFILDPDLESVIKNLSQYYQLAILSNLAKEWSEVLIDKFQFENNFSPIIISGVVGCEKPNKKIYEILVQQSQLQAQEIAFIDDRLENLATANKLGMTTIHYQRENDLFEFTPDYNINNLKQILRIYNFS
jgi:putative hydrolase of the HAD superfamily